MGHALDVTSMRTYKAHLSYGEWEACKSMSGQALVGIGMQTYGPPLTQGIRGVHQSVSSKLIMEFSTSLTTSINESTCVGHAAA